MLEEIGEITGLDIYGPNGIFIGKADKMVIDPSIRAVTGIIISEPSPVIADPGIIIKIPYRWVQSIGDIIILKVFPGYVHSDGQVE